MDTNNAADEVMHRYADATPIGISRRPLRLPTADAEMMRCFSFHDESSVVAGGYALSALHGFTVDCGDIDVFTTDFSDDRMEKLSELGYMLESQTTSPYFGSSSEYGCRIHTVYKFRHTEHRNVDVIEMSGGGPGFTMGVLSIFDISCCKVALRPVCEHVTEFTLHPEFRSNSYRLTGNKKNRRSTIARLDKYRARGFDCDTRIYLD
jgi:hypothetical protein